MAPIVFDTTVVIDLLKGRPGALGRLRALQASRDEPHVCAVTVEEVTSGLRANEREAASELIEGLATASLGMAEGRLAGWWRRRQRAQGRTITQADALIAASAAGIGARLATGNPKDFAMLDVEVEHWPVGD